MATEQPQMTYLPMLRDRKDTLDIRVTRVNNRYHARLFCEGRVIDEMACECRSDIGWICREMLRWDDKLGGGTAWASAARHRQTSTALLAGRVWWRIQLEEGR